MNSAAQSRSDELGALRVEIVRDAEWPASVDTDLISMAADAVADLAAPGPASVTIVLSDDRRIAALNTDWRGKEGATNVLSFPLDADDPEDGRVLGDVVLARETVTREAAEAGIPLEHHVLHLVIHGILHLLGYDHETDEDAEVMERLEIERLSAMGIADPYADPDIDVTTPRPSSDHADA